MVYTINGANSHLSGGLEWLRSHLFTGRVFIGELGLGVGFCELGE